MSDLLPSGTPHQPALAPSSGAAASVAHGDDGEAGESIDLKESLGTLRRHLWLVVAITLLSVGFTYYRVKRAGREYQATAVIRLVDTRRQLAGDLDNNNQSMSMGGYFTDPIASEIEVLRSRAVASAVVDSQALGLRVLATGFPAEVLRDVTLAPNVGVDTVGLDFDAAGVTVKTGESAWTVPYDSTAKVDGLSFVVRGRPGRAQRGTLHIINRSGAIDLLLAGLHARQRDRTDVVDVSYTTGDPYEAQQVVNAVVQAFQQENARTAQEQSRRRRIFVQAQLEQTDSLFRVAEDRLSKYRANKQVYGSSDAVLAAQQQGLLDLDVRKQELLADKQTYETLLGELAKQEGPARQKSLRALVALPDVANNAVVQAIYQQLVAYEAAYDSIGVGQWSSAPTNPDVLRLQTLILQQQTQLGDAVQSQITSIDARVEALDELHRRNTDILQTLPATEAGEARLVEQVEAARNMADQLREEYQKARIAEAVEAGQVEIVDLATAPYVPIGTSRRTKLLTGLIVGLLLGTGAAFVVERLNTAIRRRDEIESVLQIPGLAIIPRIASSSAGRRVKVGRMSFALPAPRRPWSPSNGEQLVTVSDFRSSTAEAFRTLRTNLIFSQAVQSLRTIVITSPSPQDGKTTTAANLAVTFAQQGMRVLLVDCDLRRARLHHLFRVSREPGLTQLMLGQCTLEQALRPTMVDHLTFLPAGTHPPNPSELLGGPQMRRTLDALAHEYDIVILDTPPVHAAADPLIVGSLADGVILVLRAGHTDRAEAQDAVQRLSSLGVRVVGAVLNDPDHKVPLYGGSYYYYDYYDSDE